TASDIFKLTVHLPDGTQEKIDEDLLIYPNPTNGLINISLPENMPVPVKATLFNVRGERMEEVTINTGTSLDLVGKPKGIYMIRLILGKEVVNRRICLF
ncbi:MAG: T9SS type A sorting domain-containing protein, partial [Bacteroidales bacterium]|nr:T9SS type A sorting domain-containing protein [Bacteroidales bacterium]